jgi:hypothetical protein
MLAAIESATPVFERGDIVISSLLPTNGDIWGFYYHRATRVAKKITVHIWRRLAEEVDLGKIPYSLPGT